MLICRIVVAEKTVMKKTEQFYPQGALTSIHLDIDSHIILNNFCRIENTSIEGSTKM